MTKYHINSPYLLFVVAFAVTFYFFGFEIAVFCALCWLYLKVCRG